jgi:MFS family permease
MSDAPAQHHLVAEDATEAMVDGDQAIRPGTARAAMRHRDFAIVWYGTFASNIGTWMQNVLLGAYAEHVWHDTVFVGALYFAQLGPLLFLSTFGGVLADAVNRRRFLIVMQLEQLVGSIVLAVLVALPHPSRSGVFVCVLLIGCGNALGAPALGAIQPNLVPREDLAGAVSLQSVQMNLSRVIGPALGAPLFAIFGAATVFGINAATYLFAIIAIGIAHYPDRTANPPKETGLAKLLSGVRIAWNDRLIRRILATLVVFSLCSLTFVGLMPAIAAHSFHIDTEGASYGFLYALFGVGATVGAISVGSIFTGYRRTPMLRVGLVGFAVSLAAFAAARSIAIAYATVTIVGFMYFVVLTTLSTVLQEHLADEVRGRILALWIMGFGGMVPIGVYAAGPIADATSLTAVLVVGAVIALLLAGYANLRAAGSPS